VALVVALPPRAGGAEPSADPRAPRTTTDAVDPREDVAPTVAAADEARAAALEAEAHVAAGRYADAARAFERSHAALPTSYALYNAALAHERAGDAVEALRRYEAYLRRDDLAPERRAVVEGAIVRLRGRVSELVLRAPDNHAPRIVRVDGRQRDPADFPLLLAPGVAQVEWGDDDGALQRRAVELAPGVRVVLELGLPPRAVPPPHVPAPVVASPEGGGPAAASRIPALRRATWSTVALVVGAAALATTFGGLALREARLQRESKCPNPCTDELLARHPPDVTRRHGDRAEAYALTTNVLLGVTSALAVAALTLGLVWLARHRRAPRAAALHAPSHAIVVP
jgi:tetratricopeptide (TPR) repeat protein